jgi:hypothetical protein
MQEHVSDDFDWVDAQAKCSAALMFDRLRTRVEEDVRRRNGLLDRRDGWKFEFYSEDDAFEVSRLIGPGKAGAVVQFERVGRRIHVQGEYRRRPHRHSDGRRERSLSICCRRGHVFRLGDQADGARASLLRGGRRAGVRPVSAIAARVPEACRRAPADGTHRDRLMHERRRRLESPASRVAPEWQCRRADARCAGDPRAPASSE